MVNKKTTLEGKIYFCERDDISCSYRTDGACGAGGGTLLPGEVCRVWYQALDSNELNRETGGLDITVATDELVSVTKRFNVTYDMSLYAGGMFSTAKKSINTKEDILVSNVAKWDGKNWYPLGDGINNYVYVLHYWKGDIYAGGIFTSPGNYLAAWNGNNWSDWGRGINSGVCTIAGSFGSNLYIGGGFTFSDGNGFAAVKSDQNSLTNIGTNLGIGSASVNTLKYLYFKGLPYERTLFAGGELQYYDRDSNSLGKFFGFWPLKTADTIGTSIARLRDNKPHDFINDAVYAIADNDAIQLADLEIYVGGAFADGNRMARITKYKYGADGFSWYQVGDGGFNDTVYVLAVMPDKTLYAGGVFTKDTNGNFLNHIAKLDIGDSSWSMLENNLGKEGDSVQSFAVIGSSTSSKLYVGGRFRFTDGEQQNIGVWDHSALEWRKDPLFSLTGLNSVVNAVILAPALVISAR